MTIVILKTLYQSVWDLFILSNSQRILNTFIREMNGFYNNSIYYEDTDSLYVEKKHWDVLDKAHLVGEEVCLSKKDTETGGIFYGLILPTKTKYCVTIDKHGITQ